MLKDNFSIQKTHHFGRVKYLLNGLKNLLTVAEYHIPDISELTSICQQSLYLISDDCRTNIAVVDVLNEIKQLLNFILTNRHRFKKHLIKTDEGRVLKMQQNLEF